MVNNNLPGNSLKDLYSLGFGTVTPQSIISNFNFPGSSGLVFTVLISNSLQLLLSTLYLGYNSLFTSMYLIQEWNSYATKRRPLRVTSATGAQRSTYWLQLPYKYSIPLLIASATLHWLVSQSIFLARVIAVDADGSEDVVDSISTCGYSNIALIFVLGLGSLLVIVVLLLGFWRFQVEMPIAGSCSAAISAACHPPEVDVDAALKSIQWGVVWDTDDKRAAAAQTDEKCDAEHCCFTSLKVTKPVEGKVYI